VKPRRKPRIIQRPDTQIDDWRYHSAHGGDSAQNRRRFGWSCRDTSFSIYPDR
jgi:hypothetical protein